MMDVMNEPDLSPPRNFQARLDPARSGKIDCSPI
jgi:hypothetical protein